MLCGQQQFGSQTTLKGNCFRIKVIQVGMVYPGILYCKAEHTLKTIPLFLLDHTWGLQDQGKSFMPSSSLNHGAQLHLNFQFSYFRKDSCASFQAGKYKQIRLSVQTNQARALSGTWNTTSQISHNHPRQNPITPGRGILPIHKWLGFTSRQ